MEKQVILFGAGRYGKEALDYFGRERVFCFADNNPALEGQRIFGLPVISFARLKEVHGDYDVVISTGASVLFAIAAQMEEAGIHHYRFFLNILEGENQGLPVPEQEDLPEEVPEGCKRVLMAAYFFPPLSGSGVFRSIKFAKYLPRFHWWPTVLSTDRPPLEMNYWDESLLREIPAGMKVVRIPDPVYSVRMRLFSPETEKALLAFLETVLRHDQEAASIARALVQTGEGRARLLTFPSPALLWAYEAVQYIETQMDLSEFDVVYTTSGPFSAHLIGFYLKETYGIPWVADYRDPWTDIHQKDWTLASLDQKLLALLERILLKAADCSIAVEEHFAKSYVERFQIPEERVSAITNGYDEADFSGLPVPEEQPPKFTMVYSGILYDKYRTTGFAAFLEALGQLIAEGSMDPADIQLRMIGAMTIEGRDVLRKYDLGAALEETGYLSHQEALKENYRASMLLLLLGDEDGIKFSYTGKFFDYLRSGRPILAFAHGDGVIAQALRVTGHGMAFSSTQLPEIKRFILREYQTWQRGGKRELLHSPRIEAFERKNLTGKLAEILDRTGAGGYRRGK